MEVMASPGVAILPHPPSAVIVFGATRFAASINGEYIRMFENHAGRPMYSKRDSSKFLLYAAFRREWQIARKPSGGGLFGSCPGPEAADPTELNSPWVIGFHTDPKVLVEALPPQKTLVVSGTEATKLDVHGEYCIVRNGIQAQDVQDSNINTSVGGPSQYWRAGAAGCTQYGEPPQWKESIVVGQQPPVTVGGRPSSRILAFVGGAWAFTEPGTLKVVASCESQLVRPGRKPHTCFSKEAGTFIISAGYDDVLPASVEVGGPAEGRAGRARGEYYREPDFDGLVAFAKPDRSMFLFYSNQLGGWQFSAALGQGSGLFHPDARPCSPDLLRGSWQIVDEGNGHIHEGPIFIMAHPPPRHLTLLGWPSYMHQFAGEYELLHSPHVSSGRPMYARNVHSTDTTKLISGLVTSFWPQSMPSVTFGSTTLAHLSYSPLAGEWRVTLGHHRVAAAFAPEAHTPDSAPNWHLTDDSVGRCFPSSELRAFVEKPGPQAVLISGWRFSLNAAVKGEYFRTTELEGNRPVYAKLDGSMHLFYNSRRAEWHISRSGNGFASAALAFCGDPHTRDPSRLPRCWTVGAQLAPEMRVEPLPPTGALRLDGTVSFVSGYFQLVGHLHRRPLYRLAAELDMSVGVGSGLHAECDQDVLLHFSAENAAWVLSRATVEAE
ncbi:unnamed protein product, partial [Polarella glacialis]